MRGVVGKKGLYGGREAMIAGRPSKLVEELLVTPVFAASFYTMK